MKTTTPKKLRSELKTYLDLASKEPIKIKRRSGKSYILISEERYIELVNIPHSNKNNQAQLKDVKISTLKIKKKKAVKPKKVIKAKKKLKK